MFDMFNIYIKKAAEIYGLPRTRQIYEKAIECLPEERSREMCTRFSEMETKLGEIDRARAIYAHCSQMCDPRITADFWQTWKDFEIRHGNEDTMREMLRIKRSVQATYNTQVNMMAAQMMNSAVGGTLADLTPGGKDSMRLLEQKAAALAAANSMPPPAAIPAAKGGSNIMFVRGETQGLPDKAKVSNPDEIDIDDESDDDDDGEDDEEMEEDVMKKIQIETKAVPSKVFGGLKKTTEVEEGDDEDM